MEPTPITIFRRELGFFSNTCFQGSRYATTLKKNVICNNGYQEEGTTTTEIISGSSRNPIYDMQYSLNTTRNKLLAIGDEDGFVSVVNEFPKVVARLQCHRHPVMSIKWSPFQSNMLATGSGDSTVGILQISDDGEMHVLYELRKHTKTIKSVAFHPDSPQVLASGGRDGWIHIWDLRCDHGRPVNSISDAHAVSQNKAAESSGQVADLLFQDSNNLISCGTTDGKIKFWDVRRTYRCLTKKFADKVFDYPTSHPHSNCKGFSSLALSQTNKLFACSVSHEIFQYDLHSNDLTEPVFTYVTPEKLSYYVRIDVSRDGRFLITGSDSEDSYIFDTLVNSAEPFYTISNNSDTIASITRFHPDDSFKVAIGYDDSEVKFWNVPEKPPQPDVHPTAKNMNCSSSLPLHFPKYKESASTNCDSENSMNMKSLIAGLPNYILDGQLAHVHSPYKIIRRRTNWFDSAKNLLKPRQQIHIETKPKVIKLKKRNLNTTNELKIVAKRIKMKQSRPVSAVNVKKNRSVSKKSELNTSGIMDYFSVEG